MAVTSFRALLDHLETGGHLRHVHRSVDAGHELMTVVRKIQQGPNFAVQFDSVTGSPLRVASNVMTPREAYAAALGVEPDSVLQTLVDRETAVQPLVEVTDAPAQEVVLTGADLDVVRDIPPIVHSEHDAGPYISAGIFIARHPDTGVYNASWNRSQLVGGDHARVRMMAPQHLGLYYEAAERRGEAMPVACIIGAPPALMLSASAKGSIESDELRLAAGLQNEPLRVVAAKTVPLLVPADAEMVIEGFVPPHAREDEGPFGEFMDAYVDVDKNHVFQVTAITRRQDAIYHAILAGTPEDLTLLGTMLNVQIHKAVNPFAPVRDIGSPGQILGCVVAIERTADTDVRAAMAAALAAHRWMKVVIFVNADVDVHSADDVLWALHTRFRPDSGILHVPELKGFSRVEGTHVGKMALDATYPPHLEPEFRRRRFPDIGKVRLKDYLLV